MRFRSLALTVSVLLGSTLAASGAHAGGSVQWQIGLETPVIRLPGHVVLPLPPIPVPRVVVTTPRPAWHGDRDDRRWDTDGDGIPNRYDRVYNPRWDRDGDGIPNRYDRRPADPYNCLPQRGPVAGHAGDAPYRGREEARYGRDDRDSRDDRGYRDYRAQRDARPNWREDQHRR